MIATALAFLAMPLAAQLPATYGKSPQEVVEQFWTTETAGGRLTVPGWYNAAAFFAVQPRSFTPERDTERDIAVVSGDFKVGDPTISGDRATVVVGCPDCRELGDLESILRLALATPTPRGLPSRDRFVAQVHARAF